MTPKERRNPKILDGKRKRRIAAGSGTKPEDINRLLKMHRQMADMMKMMGKRGGLMQRMMGMGGGGGAAPSPAEIEKMQAELARLDPRRSSPAEGAQGPAAQGPAGAWRVRWRPTHAAAAGIAGAARRSDAEISGRASWPAGKEEMKQGSAGTRGSSSQSLKPDS